jgi:hypothetical protein
MSGYVVTIALVVLGLVVAWIIINAIQGFPSPEALAKQIVTVTSTPLIASYPKNMPNRRSLFDYLKSIGTLPGTHLSLCNFYVMTANMAGLFTPVKGAAVTPIAIQYALQAGVRGLVFDIWADKKQNPILKVGVSDGSIHKLSNYTVDLSSALRMVAKEAFGNSANPTNNDPLYLVFRFRGPTPSDKLFTNTANILSQALEARRLPLPFSGTTNNTLVQQPITEYYGKIIVLSNMLAPSGNRWNEYVNNPVPPTTPIGPIHNPGDIRALSSSNLTLVQKNITQNNIVVCAPKPEDTDNTNTNSWNWKEVHAAGIHLVAMNLWSKDDNLNAYLDPTVFGTYSWMIKPVPLRYVVEHIPSPIPVSNPGYGDGNVVVK